MTEYDGKEQKRRTPRPPDPSGGEREKVLPLFLSVVCLTFIVRIYGIAVSPIISNDGVQYVAMAKLVDQGNWASINALGFFSLYPFLVALGHRIYPDWEIAGRAISLLTGSLTVLPLFFLSRRLLGYRAALVAAFFYALHPRFVEYSVDILREGPLWLFSLSALWIAREAMVRKRWPLIILAAFLTGLAVFTRLEGVIVALVIAGWVIWYIGIVDKRMKSAVLVLILFLFSMPVLASPVLVALKEKTGKWEIGHVATKLPGLLWTGPSTDVDRSPGSAGPALRGLLETAQEHRYALYTVEVFEKSGKAFGLVLVPFFLAGLIRRRQRPYSRDDVALAIWFSACFLGSIVYGVRTFYFGTRHGLTIMMPALIWSGCGFWEIEVRLRSYLQRLSLPGFFSSRNILLMAVVLLLLPASVLPRHSDKADLKKAGLLLRTDGFQGEAFAGEARLFRIGFYGGLVYSTIPDGLTFTEAVRFARERQARFLIIDDRTTQFPIEERRKAEESGVIQRAGPHALHDLKNYSVLMYQLSSR